VLGTESKTNRGFGLIEFEDCYGKKCSIQQSSIATESCLWLGVDDAEPIIMKSDAQRMGLPLPPGEISGWMPFEVPAEVQMTTRMHLTVEQVEGLVERLQAWLETEEL